MRNQNFVRAFEVGDSARDFQQAVVGTGGKSQVLDSGAKEGFHFLGGRAVGSEFAGTHLRVTEKQAHRFRDFSGRARMNHACVCGFEDLSIASMQVV